jgi:hypothetical protein
MILISKTYSTSKTLSVGACRFVGRIIDYFGADVIIGALLCWTFGLGVFLAIILALMPSF